MKRLPFFDAAAIAAGFSNPEGIEIALLNAYRKGVADAVEASAAILDEAHQDAQDFGTPIWANDLAERVRREVRPS